MSYSSVSFVCASHMCPNQYATGLVDGFYLCAMMVLGVSFVEHMVNHVRNRVTYTMEEEEDKDVDEELKEESVQEVQELVEPVQEPDQEVEDIKDQPIELEMNEYTHKEISSSS